jgi:hypothetical protein
MQRVRVEWTRLETVEITSCFDNNMLSVIVRVREVAASWFQQLYREWNQVDDLRIVNDSIRPWKELTTSCTLERKIYEYKAEKLQYK